MQLRLGPSRLVILNHPDHVQRVLQEKHAHYGRPAFVSLLRRIVGNVLCSRKATPGCATVASCNSFHRERIAGFAASMANAARGYRGR